MKTSYLLLEWTSRSGHST